MHVLHQAPAFLAARSSDSEKSVGERRPSDAVNLGICHPDPRFCLKKNKFGLATGW